MPGCIGGGIVGRGNEARLNFTRWNWQDARRMDALIGGNYRQVIDHGGVGALGRAAGETVLQGHLVACPFIPVACLPMQGNERVFQ